MTDILTDFTSLLFVLSFKFRIIKLGNDLTALLISNIYLKTDDSRDEDDERDEKKI